MADMEKQVAALLQKYGEVYTTVLEREVRIDKTVASGDTVRSIKSEMAASNKLVIQYSDVLGIVDAGIKSGGAYPNGYAILQWMKDKRIRPRNTRKGTASFAKGSQSSRNMKASAFAIARSIQRKGTIKRFGYKGSNVLDNIGIGSKVHKDLVKELTDIGIENITVVFEQLKTIK